MFLDKVVITTVFGLYTNLTVLIPTDRTETAFNVPMLVVALIEKYPLMVSVANSYI